MLHPYIEKYALPRIVVPHLLPHCSSMEVIDCCSEHQLVSCKKLSSCTEIFRYTADTTEEVQSINVISLFKKIQSPPLLHRNNPVERLCYNKEST